MINANYAMEVNLTRHCNNRCAHCNHASAFEHKYEMDLGVLERDLAMLSPIMRVRMLMAQGGEPLLHPKVVPALRLLHASGVGKQCGLLTNGRLLPKMGDEFWEMFGTLNMQLNISVYPNLDPEIVPMALEKGQRYQFTVFPQTIDGFNVVFKKNNGDSYHGCWWNRCLTMHEGYFYLCPLTAFFPKQFMNLPEHIDGLALAGLTESDLNTFLSRAEPLESCKICAGTRGERVPWHENKSRAEWLEEAGVNKL